MAKENSIFRIALIGPESTAKSTLSEDLAANYKTVWVQEHSREYLAGLDRKYMLSDVTAIAQQQLATENELLKRANHLLFADTELIIAKVWCEDVFGETPAWISEQLLPTRYDLYLLTSPDLEWKEDPLRENPHRRDFFFAWYERELRAINARYTVISGSGEQRLQNAIAAVENFLAETKK
jgi:NadR type nicotinamide-nucleotide adenylyltransferase